MNLSVNASHCHLSWQERQENGIVDLAPLLGELARSA